MKTKTPPTMRSLRLLLPTAASLLLAAAATTNAADYPSTVLADNPSAYYRLEETAGTTATDSSINLIDATYVYNSVPNSPQLGLPGIKTNSILFNGGGFSTDVGHVDIPASGFIAPSPDGTTGAPFSCELWVQPTTQPATYSVPIEVAQYPKGWNIYITGTDSGATSYFILNMPNGVLFQSALDFPISFLQWYHLVVTYDGSSILFYINGVAHGPFAVPGFLPAVGSSAHVGFGPGVGWTAFPGGVDEVAFYTNVLTVSQIQTHYQVGTNSFRPVVTPPSILADPASVTNYSGLPVSFNVTATGTLPLHYKWLKNNVPVGTDATPLTFIAQYPADDAASIQVIVTNSIGAATSQVATLTVLTNINLVAGPSSITRNVGSYAAFHAIANGAVPITYQWSNSTDGVNFTLIPNATNATLWLTNVQMAQNNNYYAVKVANPFDATTATAQLSVQARPVNVPLNGYAQIISADHPVAYWRLDETNGSTTAVDAVGSFDGQYFDTSGGGIFTYQVPTGIPYWTNDPAINITNGATVQIPFAPELNPDTTWTAEMWFSPSSLGVDGNDYRVVLSSQYNSYPNPYNGWYVYQQPNNTLAFVPQPGNGFIVAGPNDPANNNLLVANHWYYLAITDDGVNFNIYINGELRSSFPVSGIAFIPNGSGINPNGTPGLTPPGFSNTVIGRRTDGAFNPFSGTVDETAFYNYALSPAQVQAHYAGTVLLTIIKTGPTSVSISWPVGTLQSAPAVNGPYTDVSGASSPYPHSSAGAQTYYRVKLHNP